MQRAAEYIPTDDPRVVIPRRFKDSAVAFTGRNNSSFVLERLGKAELESRFVASRLRGEVHK